MPTYRLSLFGRELSIGPSNPVQESGWGGLSNNIAITVSNISSSAARVRIALQGVFPFTPELNVTVTFDARISGPRLLLQGALAVNPGGQMTIVRGPVANPNAHLPGDLAVFPLRQMDFYGDASHGFVIRIGGVADMTDFLLDFNSPGEVVDFDGAPPEGSEAWISFDLPPAPATEPAALYGLFDKTEFVVKDHAHAARRQKLTLEHLRKSRAPGRPCTWGLRLRPVAGYLLIGSDRLGKTGLAATPVLYQFALVNGSLSLEKRGDGGPLEFGQSWLPQSPGDPSTALALRVTDEHGMPVVLCADGRLAVRMRKGAGSNGLVDSLVLTTPRQEAQDVTLRAVDLTRLSDGRLLGIDTSAPAWMTETGVPLASAAPLELHGLARGTRLARAAAAGAAPAWRGQLATTAVPRSDGAEPAYELAELSLADARDWRVALQLPEQATYPGSIPDLKPDVVERNAGIDGQEFAFPLMDTGWSLANMSAAGGVAPSALASATLRTVLERLTALDGQFCAPQPGQVGPSLPRVVDPPQIADAFVHVSGARGRVASPPDFRHVFSGLNLTAPHASATAQPLPELKAAAQPLLLEDTGSAAPSPTLQYLHGGAAGANTAGLVAQAVDAGAAFGEQYPRFAKAWLQPDVTQQPVFEALRTRLNLDILKPAELVLEAIPADALQRAAHLAEDAAGGALRHLFREPEEIAQLETLEAWLAATAPDEIIAEIADFFTSPETSDDAFGWICRWFIAPPDQDLFRRLASLFTTQRKWLDDNFPGQAIAFAQALFGGLPTPSPSTLQGFLTEVLDGVSPDFELLAQLWQARDAATLGRILQAHLPPGEVVQVDRILDLFRTLRDRLGPILTNDVYVRLLELKDEAAAVLAVLQEELQRSLDRLADIVTEPPEYFVLSRRLGVMPPGRGDRLWSHNFDACRQGDIPWFFFLDTDTTVIVKTGTRQPMREVLAELQDSYRQADRPNPLSIPDDDLAAFIEAIEPDVRDRRDWVGVFILRPTFDLSQDIIVSSMTGLNTIDGLYVALGGGRPDQTPAGGADVDVIARIRKSAPAPNIGEKLDLRDADLSVVKFDVTIRNTRIAQGEIACRLSLVDLFGRDYKVPPGGEPAAPPGNAPATPPSMLIQAVLPAAKVNDPARAFEFGCFFDKPLVVDVDILFVKSVAFRSLKAVRHGGSVALDIDADLGLQSSPLLPIDLGDNPVLRLKDFRIRLPGTGPGNLRMGRAQFVAFDFPALSINLPSLRTLNLSGIDIIPTGLGFLRLRGGEASTELADLKSRFRGFSIPGFDFMKLEDLVDGNYTLPTVKMTLDFGKLPLLGGGGGFRLDLVMGVCVEGGIQGRPFIGIGGFEADRLKIDLFRFITLEIEKLILSNEYAAGLQGPAERIGLLLAQKIQLKILDWSPLDDDDELSLAYMNYADPKSGRGDKSWLVSLQMRDPPDNFLQIYGIVLAKGLEFEPGLYNLLLGNLDDAQSVVGSFIDTTAKHVKANVSGNLPWLMAVTFGLRGILERCAFVLQDGRYYGIRLSAPWLQAVFEVDSLSLAYIPGPTPTQDRFRVAVTIPKLNMIADMRSGEIALEWAVNQDFLVDIGFPWLDSQGYNWFRAFSIPMTPYEVKFGFYFEKRTHVEADGNLVTFGAGFAFYFGYYFGMGNSIAWLRAGIGVFAVLQASLTIDLTAKVSSIAQLPSVIHSVEIVGAIGIFAYGEGGIDVWVLSARFRVSAQASVTVRILITRGQPTALSFTVLLSVGYSASVRIGCGFFSWTFSVSGSLGIPVSGRLMLG